MCMEERTVYGKSFLWVIAVYKIATLYGLRYLLSNEMSGKTRYDELTEPRVEPSYDASDKGTPRHSYEPNHHMDTAIGHPRYEVILQGYTITIKHLKNTMPLQILFNI